MNTETERQGCQTNKQDWYLFVSYIEKGGPSKGRNFITKSILNDLSSYFNNKIYIIF